MRRSLAAALALLIVVPLGLLAYLAARVAHDERLILEQGFRQLVEGRLGDIDRSLARWMSARERELDRITTLREMGAAQIRRGVLAHPLISRVAVVDPRGSFVFPAADSRDVLDREWMERVTRLHLERNLGYQAPPEVAGLPAASPADPSQAALSSSTAASQGLAPAAGTATPRHGTTAVADARAGAAGRSAAAGAHAASVAAGPAGTAGALGASVSGPRASFVPGHGWYVSYWASGVDLLFWHRLETGHLVVAALDRAYLLAGLIGELPAGDGQTSPLVGGRIALADSGDTVMYSWGDTVPPAGQAPAAQRVLASPLSSWKLTYHAAPSAIDSYLAAGATVSMAGGVGAVMLALCLLGVHAWREYSRDVREAAQRVSFVNQVSHELKTPLTNIRLYAELLEGALGETEGERARLLGVIVDESRRLSRMIGNVLTFSRDQRGALSIRPSPGRVDEIVDACVAHFRPSLDARGIAITVEHGAGGLVGVDGDALSQILGNLLSNVEKYAAAGREARIETRQTGPTVEVVVRDLGPGVPEAMRERIFEPFVRLDDRTTEGVTGAGIGLTIARALARLHGGDLAMQESPRGSSFRLTLRAEPVQGSEER